MPPMTPEASDAMDTRTPSTPGSPATPSHDALGTSEALYRLFFESVDQGFGIAEILLDASGNPSDYRMLEINPRFEQLIGQPREAFLDGRTVREVAPELEEEWIAFYGNVGLTGVPARRELYADAWDRWFEVTAYRTGAPELRRVAILYWDITERKRTEAELREREEQLRILAELVPDLLWRSDPHGDTTWLNQRWLDYTGQTLEEATGWGWANVIHPDEQARSAENYRRAAETGLPLEQEHRIRRHDGAYRWFLVRAEPIRDEAGVVHHWSGAATDIHDQRVAVEALCESETVGVLFFTLGGGITDANAALARMSGYTREELRALDDWGVLTPPEFQEATERAASELATYGRTAPYEKQWIRKDGSRFWGQFSPTRLSGVGEQSECVEFIVDSTERKQAEVALQESEERYRRIVDQATDYAILSTDAERRIETWSLGAEVTFGWTAEEVVGQLVDITFTPEDRTTGQVERELAQARKEGSAPDVRWHQRKDGTRVFIDGMTYARQAENGVFQGVFKVGQDVTARLQEEDARRELEARYREGLEAEVAAATAQLRTLSRRLLLVQEEERRKLALELHDEIGQVLTGLAFQLAAAQGGDGATALAVANTTVQGLTEQVRQMSLDLRPQVLDRYGLLAAVTWYLERYQATTGITIHLREQGVAHQRYPPEVEIAAFRVVQEALTNIARHAGVEEAWVTLFGDGSLLVVIHDQGQGFDPVQHGESSGLGGMRERVELLGGSFDVETAPGEGVHITAEFRLEEGAQAGDPHELEEGSR